MDPAPLERLCAEARTLAGSATMRSTVDEIDRRWRGPLIITVVGERGAGRSTLIDALTRLRGQSASVSLEVDPETAPGGRPDVVIEVMTDETERRWDLDLVWHGATPTPGPFTSVTVINRLDERAHGIPGLLAEAGQPPPGIDHVVSARMAATAADITSEELTALAELRGDTLGSAAAFVGSPLGSTTAPQRRRLLERFTLLGLRVASTIGGGDRGADAVRHALLEASGIQPLRRRIDERILPRGRVLQAVGVLNDLRGLAAEIERFDSDRAAALVAAIDRAIADSYEISALRCAHLAALGRLGLAHDDVEELLAVTAGGMPPAVRSAEARVRPALILTSMSRWRSIGDNVFADSDLRESADCVCRGLERAYAELAAGH